MLLKLYSRCFSISFFIMFQNVIGNWMWKSDRNENGARKKEGQFRITNCTFPVDSINNERWNWQQTKINNDSCKRKRIHFVHFDYLQLENVSFVCEKRSGISSFIGPVSFTPRFVSFAHISIVIFSIYHLFVRASSSQLDRMVKVKKFCLPSLQIGWYLSFES